MFGFDWLLLGLLGAAVGAGGSYVVRKVMGRGKPDGQPAQPGPSPADPSAQGADGSAGQGAASSAAAPAPAADQRSIEASAPPASWLNSQQGRPEPFPTAGLSSDDPYDSMSGPSPAGSGGPSVPPAGRLERPAQEPLPIDDEDSHTGLKDRPISTADEEDNLALLDEPGSGLPVRPVDDSSIQPAKRGRDQLEALEEEELDNEEYSGLTPPNLPWAVDDIAPRSSRQAKYRRTLRNAETFVDDLEIDSAVHLYERTKERINNPDAESKIDENINELNSWKDNVRKLRKDVEEKIIQPVVMPYTPGPEHSEKLGRILDRIADNLDLGGGVYQPQINIPPPGGRAPEPGDDKATDDFPPGPGGGPGGDGQGEGPGGGDGSGLGPGAGPGQEEATKQQELAGAGGGGASASGGAVEPLTSEPFQLDDSQFGLDDPMFDNLPEEDRRGEQRRDTSDQRRDTETGRRMGQERRGEDLFALRDKLREKKKEAEDALRKKLDEARQQALAQAEEATQAEPRPMGDSPYTDAIEAPTWRVMDTEVPPEVYESDVTPLPIEEHAGPDTPQRQVELPELPEMGGVDKAPKTLETSLAPEMPEVVGPDFVGGGPGRPPLGTDIEGMDDPETLPEDFGKDYDQREPEEPEQPDQENVLDSPQIPPLGGGLGGSESDEEGGDEPIQDDSAAQKIHGILELKPPEEEDSPFLTLTYDFSKIPDSFELSKDYHSMEYAYYKYKPMLLKAQEFTRRKMLSNALNYYRIIKSQNIPSEFRRMVNRNIKDITEYLEKFLMAKGG